MVFETALKRKNPECGRAGFFPTAILAALQAGHVSLQPQNLLLQHPRFSGLPFLIKKPTGGVEPPTYALRMRIAFFQKC